jgi:hypothetical protein
LFRSDTSYNAIQCDRSALFAGSAEITRDHSVWQFAGVGKTKNAAPSRNRQQAQQRAGGCSRGPFSNSISRRRKIAHLYRSAVLKSPAASASADPRLA